MKTTSSAPFTSLVLKLVGIILIISSLIDYIVLVIPSGDQSVLEPQWQVGLVTAVVDRGIVPMVGMMFLFLGYWIESSIRGGVPAQQSLDIRLPVFILASFLGLIFLLAVPLHLNNLRLLSQEQSKTIAAQATEAEARLQTQYDQLNAISQNPGQLEQGIRQINQALNSGQLNQQQQQAANQQKSQLQQLSDLAKNNPKEFKSILKKRLDELQNQLGARKLEVEKQAKANTFKSGIRTGLSSLMLAVGYIAIGWLGLRSMGTPKTSIG